MPDEQRPGRASAIALIALVLGGAILRAWGWTSQVPVDDELHGIIAALQHDGRYLFTHHAPSDYTIPLALWNRLAVVGPGLDEVWLRAPMLAAGIGLLAVLALVLRQKSAVAVIATAFAACSPLLVRYSRYARPYGIVALASFVAVIAALRWRRGGGPGWGLLLACATPLALWLTPTCAPAVMVAWIVAAWPAPGSLAERATAAAPTVAGVAAALLLLGPSLPSLLSVLGTKVGAVQIGLPSWWQAAALVMGPRESILIAWFLVSAAVGAWSCARADRGFALAGTSVVALELLAIQVARPYGGNEDHVLARYTFAALPWMLVFVAHGAWAEGLGLARVARLPPRATALVLSVVMLLVVVWRGPLPRLYDRPNAFTNHNELWRAQPGSEEPSLPSFASRIEPRGRVVEAPWVDMWSHEIYHLHQRRHGRPVVTTLAEVPPALRFRTILPVETLELAPDDLLIVHRDVVVEAQRIAQRPLDRRVQQIYRAEAERVLAIARARFRPVHEDEEVVVFTASR